MPKLLFRSWRQTAPQDENTRLLANQPIAQYHTNGAPKQTVTIPAALQKMPEEFCMLRDEIIESLLQYELSEKRIRVVLQIEASAKMRIPFLDNPKAFAQLVNQIALIAALLGNIQLEVYPIAESAGKSFTLKLNRAFFAVDNTESVLADMFKSVHKEEKDGPADFAEVFRTSRELNPLDSTLRITLTNAIPEVYSKQREVKRFVDEDSSQGIKQKEMNAEFVKASAVKISDHIVGLGALQVHKFPLIGMLPHHTTARVSLAEKAERFDVNRFIESLAPQIAPKGARRLGV